MMLYRAALHTEEGNRSATAVWTAHSVLLLRHALPALEAPPDTLGRQASVLDVYGVHPDRSLQTLRRSASTP